MNWNFVKSISKTLHQSMSENGEGSFSRITGAAVVLATLGWVTYIVIKTSALPNLTDASIFLASGSSAYAVNQAKHVAAAIKGNANGPQTEDPAPVGAPPPQA